MGQGQSNIRLYQKLYHVMPALHSSNNDKILTGFFDKTLKPFESDKDRDQFIYATITVLSQNGRLDIKDHDFRLLYSRRENERMVARIVAEREGVVKAQIEPAEDGKTQAEAFLALRRHVEIELDEVLRDVPGATSTKSERYLDDRSDDYGKPKPARKPSSHSPHSPPAPHSPPGRQGVARPVQLDEQNSGQRLVPMEAPPAYGRAVKDWRVEEKK